MGNANSTVTTLATYGAASATTSGNKLTISQTTNQAILNWSSFNIGAGGQVVFQQPGAASIALNKIYDANPSSIFGELTANGQVYLINPNGFVFGSGATVGVAGLMASSLGLYSGDAEFTGNTIYTQSTASFLPALGTAGSAATPGSIVIQAGATISAASGGNILIAGGSVTNGGSVSAPGGQVALAAGQTIYLAESTDSSLRGLLVEVTGPGTVTNQAGGTLSASQGNVSLVGLAVNQSGVISATTAVSANGSVYLVAADGAPSGQGSGAVTCNNGAAMCATTGGTLSMGSTSEINISPDASGGTAVAGQPQTQSVINIEGQQVDVGGEISAPAATLNVTAESNLNSQDLTTGDSGAELRIASGTDIDLEGSVAQLPMSANLLSIQLLDNELEDDPLQRSGALHGQTVVVNLLDGQPAIISDSSWSAALEGIEENIYQRTAAGGTANFQSSGDVVFSSGALINVSGGAWQYASGALQTSYLVGSDGALYSVETASPDVSYSGVLNPTYTQTYNGYGVQVTQPTPGLGYYTSGFSEGFSAGSVTFAASNMALQGSLQAGATDGAEQRGAASIPATSFPALVAYINQNSSVVGDADPFPASGGVAIATGGTLQIGTPGSEPGDSDPQFYAPGVGIVATPSSVSVADGTPYVSSMLQLPSAYLTNDGFANTAIYSDGAVTLPAGLPLNLGSGSSLQIVAPFTAIDSSIQALGGNIDVQTVQTAENQRGSGALGIAIGAGVTLDVSGQWTNDTADAPASTLTATYLNGGSIDLSLTSSLPLVTSQYPGLTYDGSLQIGSDVSLLANGGAWLQGNGKLVDGTGGDITLDASPYESALQIGSDLSLQAFGVEGAVGGAFTLNAPSIEVINGSASPLANSGAPAGGTTLVGASLFTSDGFSNVSLTATGSAASTGSDLLTVTGGINIAMGDQTLALTSNYLQDATGGSITGFSNTEVLPESQQRPDTVALSVTPAFTDADPTIGILDIQSGASLTAAPSSSITLAGEGSVLINGILTAPGGTITAEIPTPDSFGTHTSIADDPGFLPNQVLQLGSSGVLDVQGATIATPNTLNLPLGTVLDGGTVSLVADRGQIVTEPGSSIDIAGATASLDELSNGRYQLTTVGSAGGMLDVQASESISLLGALSAAGGASSGGQVAGGTLAISLTAAPAVSGGGTAFPTAPDTIDIVSSNPTSPSASDANEAVVGIPQLQQSGIGALMLQTPDTIELSSSTPLSLAGEISLDAPSVAVDPGVPAALSAPYIVFTDTLGNPSGAVAASAGTGTLAVNAQQIVLIGYTTLQGVQSTSLDATLNGYAGDVEFEPLSLVYSAGGLTLDGDLGIDAARVYPATNTRYTIATSGTVTMEGPSTATNPATPLSANGSLTIDATNINIGSGGALLAPFGQIALLASDSLSLTAGSMVSVSGAGTAIPYGQTAFGQEEWIYEQGNASIGVDGVPNREVTLSAPGISIASGATVNLTGGGELEAYEWVPDTGGSVDALSSSSAAAQGYYAIVPTEGPYAAYDMQNSSGANIGAAEDVYLSGASGLPAGVYALLPARDALLPGAYLIQVESSFQSTTSGVLGKTATGASVIAGYFTLGDTPVHTTSSGYEGFAVYPGSYAQSLASYTVTTASNFFGPGGTDAGGAIPADAGTLMIDVGGALNLLGSVQTAAGTGGTAATIDLYTPSPTGLTVTASQGDGASGTGPMIAASTLAGWNAGDLIIGGNLSSDGTSIDVTASTVTVDSGATLSAGQVLLVADQGVDVQAGATVASNSGLTATALPATPASTLLTLDDSSGGADANAALLAVSDSSLLIAQRSGTPTAGATITMAGTLETRGALALDAPSTIGVTGSINAPGAAWSMGSSSIAFISQSGASSDTLEIGPGLLSQMQSAGGIRLASTGAIDLQTPVSLGISSSGAPTLDSLTLSASAINNDAGGAVVFGAQTLLLQGGGAGSGASDVPTAIAGLGTLRLVGGTIELGGSGSLAINRNALTTLSASNSVEGEGGTIAIGGSVSVGAPELTAAADTDTVLAAGGALQIQQSGTAAAPTALMDSLGGAIALTANAISDTGSIIVPGGTISLQAKSNLVLGATADIDASGIAVNELGTYAYASGGNVTLAAGGNLTLPAGATIGVAGALPVVGDAESTDDEAPAGSLTLVTGGVATLGAALDASAASGATGGSFTLTATQLSGNLASLPTATNAGTTQLLPGFTNAVSIEVGSGDLDITAGESLTANQISLTADTGSIDVAGTLNAPSAALRGSIGLFADQNLTIESSAQLFANGSGANGLGGQIELSAGNNAASAANAAITLDSGALISASGEAQMGTLVLRAPALTTTADVAINGNVAGAVGTGQIDVGQITIEPVLAPVSGDFTSNPSLIATPVSAYLTQVQEGGGLPSNLVAANTVLEPAVVVQAAGNLTLGQSLDIASLGLGAPIDLSVQAAGSLNVGGSIAGYNVLSDVGQPTATSLHFVAGADLDSANPLATANPLISTLAAGANLDLGPGALVQTGSGNIDLVASGNVEFDTGASAYTTGNAHGAGPVTVNQLGTLYFPTGGGNVTVRAGGDVIGQGSLGSVTNWQGRTSVKGLGEWGVDLAAFNAQPWSVATFGGGDISISAGGDIVNVTAAAADSTLVNSSALTQTHYSSGGLSVESGGNVINGQFFAADGTGAFSVGGSLQASATDVGSSGSIGTLFALENSQISIWAQQDLEVDAIVDPTLLDQPAAGLGLAAISFSTYGADSAFSAQSNGGNVTLSNSSATAGLVTGGSYYTSTLYNAFDVLPTNLNLTALAGNLQLAAEEGVLYPSSSGELQLFAGGNVVAGGNSNLAMSDAPAGVLATASDYTAALGPNFVNLTDIIGSAYAFDADLHAGQSTPASVIAGGSIDDLHLAIPEVATIKAGGNIVDLQYFGQNLHSSDVTLIDAGGSFTDAPTFVPSSGAVTGDGDNVGIQVGGPGYLDILAGGTIDLAFSQGVATVGNEINGNLPSGGASITMAAGLGASGANYANFYQQIVAPDTTYQQALLGYVESLTGQSNLTRSQADADFLSLAGDQQSAFIDQVFFDQLNESGIEATSGSGAGYSLGYTAIQALFPGSPTSSSGSTNPYSGDLDLTYSRVYSLGGGDISLLLPGGSVNVGLAQPPGNFATNKSASDLGIVAEGAGDVDIYSYGNVNVNTSRVFTLGGGNILIWSQTGNIDAGNGAKTSLSIPPPTVSFNATTGEETLNYDSAVAGSGIRTIQTSDSEPAGNVDLIAPIGSVNAGDAGIGAAGDINIAALAVTGIANISFGGTATGVPALVSNLTASLSGASSSASAAATSASASLEQETTSTQAEAAPLAQAAINWLDVFVTGLGQENCRPDDLQCLQREQQPPHLAPSH